VSTQTLRLSIAVALIFCWHWTPADAQTFEGPGTRAQGMAAFVAVADDASAVYWNPAGVGSGAFFSLLLDRTDAETSAGGADPAASRSTWLLALSAKAVGLSYYRLRFTTASPASGVPAGQAPAANGVPLSHVESLVTHNTGATVVRSITDHVIVGATVRLVRGVATVGDVLGRAEDLVHDWELMGVASNRVDADLGIMATGNIVRAGVTVRNLRQPKFDTGGGGELRLDRQARAGIAVLLTPRWTAAVDLDLTENRGPFGDVRTLAFGAEGRLTRRAFARGGVQVNTAGEDGRDPAATIGGSYAALGSLLIDAHFSTGSDRALRGWGVAGRVVF
jgi:hypothetical protein